MMRIPPVSGLLILAGLAAAPASALAGGYTVINGPMPLIGTMPQAPARAPGFAPAPVPNHSIVAPRTTKVPVPGEPEFVVDHHGVQPAAGAGYSAGSNFSETPQRGGRHFRQRRGAQRRASRCRSEK